MEKRVAAPSASRPSSKRRKLLGGFVDDSEEDSDKETKLDTNNDREKVHHREPENGAKYEHRYPVPIVSPLMQSHLYSRIDESSPAFLRAQKVDIDRLRTLLGKNKRMANMEHNSSSKTPKHSSALRKGMLPAPKEPNNCSVSGKAQRTSSTHASVSISSTANSKPSSTVANELITNMAKPIRRTFESGLTRSAPAPMANRPPLLPKTLVSATHSGRALSNTTAKQNGTRSVPPLSVPQKGYPTLGKTKVLGSLNPRIRQTGKQHDKEADHKIASMPPALGKPESDGQTKIQPQNSNFTQALHKKQIGELHEFLRKQARSAHQSLPRPKHQSIHYSKSNDTPIRTQNPISQAALCAPLAQPQTAYITDSAAQTSRNVSPIQMREAMNSMSHPIKTIPPTQSLATDLASQRDTSQTSSNEFKKDRSILNSSLIPPDEQSKITRQPVRGMGPTGANSECNTTITSTIQLTKDGSALESGQDPPVKMPVVKLWSPKSSVAISSAAPNFSPAIQSSQIITHELDTGASEEKSLPMFTIPTCSTLPTHAEPYFEFSIFQKIWSGSQTESLSPATEVIFRPCTDLDEANSQAERLFNILREQYQQFFQVQCSEWSNKRDEYGCNVLVGTFAPIEYPATKIHIRIWVRRDHVSAYATRGEKEVKHTNFVAKTMYILRLFKLPSPGLDIDREGPSEFSDHAITRVYHPLPCTECYTTLEAANRAAKKLQVELSHEKNPKASTKLWQVSNLEELNKKVSDLEKAEEEGVKYWKSLFNGCGLGSAKFELVVEQVRLCGPRNL